MARLINWPVGLGITDIEFLSGPRTVGASTTTSIGGFLQTVSSPFGAWAFKFSFPPLIGDAARRHRGWVGALHGGANATRFTFVDGDLMSASAAGIVGEYSDQPWSNGEPWSNGRNWKRSYPAVAMAAAASLGDTTISISDSFWGHNLDVGDLVGFFPFHLGMYEITERIAAGQYRIWPSLRKALATTDYATLRPVLALRLMSQDAASLGRDAQSTVGLSATFVEVLDYDARAYFADTTAVASVSTPLHYAASGNFINDAYIVNGSAATRATALSFTRASPATYFGSDGLLKTAAVDEWRIDHDPLTKLARGVLLEAAVSNAVPYSHDLSNFYGAGTINLAAAEADPFGATGSVYWGSVSENVMYFDGGNNAVAAGSFYAKLRPGSGATSIALQFFQNTVGVVADLFTYVFELSGSNADGAHVKNVERDVLPNGWFRFRFRLDADPAKDTGVMTSHARVDIEAGGPNYITGIQIEPGASVASSYIKTDGSAGSRAADSLVLNASGTNNWTIETDAGDVTFSGIAGNLTLTAADVPGRLRSYVAVSA